MPSGTTNTATSSELPLASPVVIEGPPPEPEPSTPCRAAASATFLPEELTPAGLVAIG
jgi:hypothetical protein